MKNILACLLLFIFLSCSQSAKKPGKESGKSTPKTLVKLKTHPNDTIPLYDSTVYKKYIDTSVLQLLQSNLPEWHLPPPALWEKFWFNEYKKNEYLVNYAYADFNGDNKTDYAFILDNDKAIAVWILQSEGNRYKAIKLQDLGELTSTIDTGIDLVPKGKLDYIDLDNDSDNPKPINLKHPALTITSFERAAETYYWQNGQYKSVTTGD
jgi:hypothetical protein